MAKKRKDDGMDMTNGEMLKMIMQEFTDLRNELIRELGGRIDALSNRVEALSSRVDALSNRVEALSSRVDELAADFKSFRAETRQNFATFIRNHSELEKRVSALEMAA